MREKLKEYFHCSEFDTKQVWGNCIIVLDTNILLSLYEFDQEQVSTILKSLGDGEVSKKLWMPYYVAREFMNNRENTIRKRLEARSIKIAAVYEAIAGLKNEKSFNENKVKELKEEFKKWISLPENNNIINALDQEQDEILKWIILKFNKKIGERYNEDREKELHNQYEQRVKLKIPPGCNEIKDNNRAGDYLIWCEILEVANKTNKDVIFVTEDLKKGDWAREISLNMLDNVERLVLDLPSLVREFSLKTNQRFTVRNLMQFLELCKKYGDVQNKPQLNKLLTHNFPTISDVEFEYSMNSLNLLFVQVNGILRDHDVLMSSRVKKDFVSRLSKIDYDQLSIIFEQVSETVSEYIGPECFSDSSVSIRNRLFRISRSISEYIYRKSLDSVDIFKTM